MSSQLRPWLWPALAVLLLGLLALPQVNANAALMNLCVDTLMYVAMATAWNLGCGFSGYISFGHVAFFGFGAYGLGLLLAQLAASGVDLGPWAPFGLAPVIGVVTGLFAIPFGWIAFRTRHTAFVIVTIALMFVLQLLAYNLRDLTGGAQGLGFPVGPWERSYATPFYYVMLAVATITILGSWVVRRSEFGLGLLAIRDDEDKAQSIGVPTGEYKLAAYVMSAAVFGTIGGIYGYYITYIYPQTAVDPLISGSVVLMSFLGGVGTLLGPILGALIVEPSQLLLGYNLDAAFYLIAYGALFLVVVLLLPRGIVPSLSDRFEERRAASARAAAAVAEAADPGSGEAP